MRRHLGELEDALAEPEVVEGEANVETVELRLELGDDLTLRESSFVNLERQLKIGTDCPRPAQRVDELGLGRAPRDAY